MSRSSVGCLVARLELALQFYILLSQLLIALGQSGVDFTEFCQLFSQMVFFGVKMSLLIMT